MKTYLLPVSFGVFSGLALIIALWQLLPLMFLSEPADWLPWFPFLVTFPGLLLGAFISAKQMSKHDNTIKAGSALWAGALTGIVIMLVFSLVTALKVPFLFRLLLLIMAGLIAGWVASKVAKKQ